MAKKKGAKKASRSVPRQTGVNVAPAEAARAAAGDEAELRSGAEATRLLTEILKAIEAERSEHAIAAEATRQEMQRLQEQLNRLESRLPERESEPSQPPEEEPTTPARSARLAVIEGWRKEIWIREDENTKLRRPRATLIGRALMHLGATDVRYSYDIIEFFEVLEQKGPHHLSDRINQDLATYRDKTSHEAKRRKKDASSNLTKLLNTRYEWLCRKATAEGGGARCVSSRGRQVFDGWPDWNVQDDAPAECYGRVLPPQDPTA